MKLRGVFLLLSPLVGLGILGWVALDTGVSLAGATGLIPLPFQLLAVAAFLLSLLGRGARIALLARGLGARLGLVEAAATQLTGEAAAAATPSRTGSDPARLLFLKRLGVDLPTGISVLAGEIMAEGVVLAVLVPLLALSLPGSRAVALGALPYAAASLALPFAAFFLVRRPGSRIPPRPWSALGLTEHRWREFRVGARRFRSKALALTRLDRGTITAVLLVSLVHVLARLSILPLLAWGVAPGAPLAPLVAWPLVLLYTGSLLPPPGGGGAVEITFIAALSSVLGESALAGTLLWWRLYTFYLGAMAGALILAATLGRAGFSELGWSGKRPGVGARERAVTGAR